MPFLRKGQVQPHWEELVTQSTNFSRTDNNIDTWDSLQTPDQIEEGEIISTNDALPREADSEGAQSTENTPIPVASNDSQANPIISNSDRMTEDPSSKDSHVQITQYDLDINENQASSPSLEQSNDNETAPTFSPLESFGINPNNIYESGVSYSENNIISQS